MADRETLDVYNERAASYAEMTAADEPDPALVRFMSLLESGSSILDLGCGPGDASGIFAENGHVPDPVDASEAMVEFACKKNVLQARTGTFDQIGEWGPYQGVWANFSLLHASREKVPEHLEAIAGIVEPGGIFHIGMKLGAGEKRDSLGRRYSYFSEEELRLMLEGSGFQIVSVSNGEGVGFAGDVEPWIVVLSKRLASHDAAKGPDRRT